MKKLIKILMIVFVFSCSLSAQTQYQYSVNNQVYEIGTGLSLNYYSENIGIMIDSYHFFDASRYGLDKVLLRIGGGLNYRLNDKFKEDPIGFIGTASLGYIYEIDNITIRSIYNFGTGITADYTYVSLNMQAVGATLYLLLNEYIIGLGTGIIIAGPYELFAPYMRVNIGLSF